MSTSTSTIELTSLPQHPLPTKQSSLGRGLILQDQPPTSQNSVDQLVDECATGENAGTVVSAAQKWNDPGNAARVAAAFWTLFVMGANDSAYGPLLPYLGRHYDVSYIIVSLVFLSPFIGYVASALLNNYIHLHYGQRGIAIISSTSHLAAYIIIASHPPYIVLVLAFILAGFGNGVADAAWNAWLGNLANSSELLGLLHACYGVGGVMSPLASTSMITKAGLPWYTFYYLMIGFAVIELAVTTAAFWTSTGSVYRAINNEDETNKKEANLSDAIFHMPTARVAWVAAAFLICYVGVEVALGGWIVEFMNRVRHGDDFSAGMPAVGFWLGITVGRVVLGFVSPRIGVKLATSIYIASAIGLELVFWLVPQFIVSAIAVALQGFFLGPLFPSVILVANKLLPRHQHVVVIGFAAAFGGCGAAVLPFVTGLLAQSAGVQVLQPIILSLLVLMLGIWLLFPRIDKKRD